MLKCHGLRELAWPAPRARRTRAPARPRAARAGAGPRTAPPRRRRAPAHDTEHTAQKSLFFQSIVLTIHDSTGAHVYSLEKYNPSAISVFHEVKRAIDTSG